MEHSVEQVLVINDNLNQQIKRLAEENSVLLAACNNLQRDHIKLTEKYEILVLYVLQSSLLFMRVEK